MSEDDWVSSEGMSLLSRDSAQEKEYPPTVGASWIDPSDGFFI